MCPRRVFVGGIVPVKPFLVRDTWCEGGGTPFTTINQADGQVIAEVGTADCHDVEQAVEAAQAASRDPHWRFILPHEGARMLHRMGNLIDRDIDALAHLQMTDNGKTLAECRGQFASAANTFRYYATACETAESEVTSPRGPYWTMTVFQPVGVVPAVTPWNSPAGAGSRVPARRGERRHRRGRNGTPSGRASGGGHDQLHRRQ
jgi:betaine-aldehyde dehydrogenase